MIEAVSSSAPLLIFFPSLPSPFSPSLYHVFIVLFSYFYLLTTVEASPPQIFWLQCLGRAGHAPREVGRYIFKSLRLSWTVRWPPKVIRHTQLPIRPSHYYGPLIWSKYGPSNPPFLMTKSVISGWSSGSFAYCKFLNFTDSFHTVLCSAWALPLYNV